MDELLLHINFILTNNKYLERKFIQKKYNLHFNNYITKNIF